MAEKEKRLNRIKTRLTSLLSHIDAIHRGQATELTALELRELENLFVLLLLNAFSGIPFPPFCLAVELLPYLEREIKVMSSRAEGASDTLAEMAGILKCL